MKLKIKRSVLQGEIKIPASKSHTIRAIAIATMAEGRSILRKPLVSADTLSCVEAAKAFGAAVFIGDDYIITGIGKKIKKSCAINVGNSGTTLRLFTSLAALADKEIYFDGDNSIRQRPMEPLFNSLRQLGASIITDTEKCPFIIKGPLMGGKTSIKAVSSQFLSALLMACPLASDDTEIIVEQLNEHPYVEITLDWLKKQKITFEQKNMDWFKIKGRQHYRPFDMTIPADFSTATFALVGAVVTGGDVMIKGLDFSDSQGDKLIFSHLEKMGAEITHTDDVVFVRAINGLQGIDIDMNATPDALPAMAVVGCFAQGTTRLLNVPQARLKECDRIKACAIELSKMGAKIEELPDGLVIHQSNLKGSHVHGWNDHRMVMALAIAGMFANGDTIVDTAEATRVTYPEFVKDFSLLGAEIQEL